MTILKTDSYLKKKKKKQDEFSKAQEPRTHGGLLPRPSWPIFPTLSFTLHRRDPKPFPGAVRFVVCETRRDCTLTETISTAEVKATHFWGPQRPSVCTAFHSSGATQEAAGSDFTAGSPAPRLRPSPRRALAPAHAQTSARDR